MFAPGWWQPDVAAASFRFHAASTGMAVAGLHAGKAASATVKRSCGCRPTCVEMNISQADGDRGSRRATSRRAAMKAGSPQREREHEDAGAVGGLARRVPQGAERDEER